LIELIPPEIMAQIFNQAGHDPEVFVTGAGEIINGGPREGATRLDVTACSEPFILGRNFC
jgi:hypothetical protein